MTRGPVLIDLEDETSSASPATAPPIPEDDAPNGAAMTRVVALAARRPSVMFRWFWGSLLGLFGFVVSLATWDYIAQLLDRSPILGLIALGLLTIFCCVLAAIALREVSAFARLRKVDGLQTQAQAVLDGGSLSDARAVVAGLRRLYRGRDDVRWGFERLDERQADVLDADALIGLAETTVLEPLDAQAKREVEAAARQVATVTAIVPLALADVFAALTSNLRMIRRVAEIYGGRAGTLGGIRLARSVVTHLVATGAVAVGDDLIGSVAGGGVLSKVSRRFGEGVINGALTARVGVAAIEVCRPLPFHQTKRPSVTSLVRRALTGVFGTS